MVPRFSVADFAVVVLLGVVGLGVVDLVVGEQAVMPSVQVCSKLMLSAPHVPRQDPPFAQQVSSPSSFRAHLGHSKSESKVHLISIWGHRLEVIVFSPPMPVFSGLPS